MKHIWIQFKTQSLLSTSVPNTSTLNRAKFPIKITNNSSNLSKIKIDSSQLICDINNKLKTTTNCQQIYNNFYNIFNPEIQNINKIREVSKNINVSNECSKENMISSQEMIDFKKEIHDYKRQIYEKNEYIKGLVSENFRLKEKLKKFSLEYKKLMKKHKEISEIASNSIPNTMNTPIEMSIRDNKLPELENSPVSNKLNFKPPKSTMNNYKSADVSNELIKRNYCVSANNNEYISTIDEFKSNLKFINSSIEASNNCSPPLNQMDFCSLTLRTISDKERVRDNVMITFNKLKQRTQRILDQYLEKIYKLKK